jgi:capsular exopolysaccharide synthesis family protein
MSKFFQALEQARRDRALAREGGERGARPEAPLAPAPPPTAPGRPQAVPPALESADGVDEHLVSLVTPAAFEAEQYRALRHQVEQLRKASNVAVVAVSSPAIGDGKTTTAANLAGALAQSSQSRVLLVDADLRRPALARLLALGQPASPGLVDAILDPDLGLGQVAQPRPPFNLDVVPSGPRPPAPYELLRSPRLGELLEEARRRYDYVVLDVPPLVPVQDCRVIARWVDGFLLVVRAHRTPRRLLEEAFGVVEPAKVIGLVFNDDDHPLSGYYSTYYRGYAYLPEPGNGHGPARWRRVVRAVTGPLRQRRLPEARTGRSR